MRLTIDTPEPINRLILCISHLVPELQNHRTNSNEFVMMVVTLIILIIGFMGAYRDHRQMLLTFAIALTVVFVIGVVQKQAIAIVGETILDIVSVVLAVFQSEMIRTGDMR